MVVEKLLLEMKYSTEQCKMLRPLGCYMYIVVGATLRLLQFENYLFGVPQWGGSNDRLLEKWTVATVAVARGDSNPVVVTFWVRRGFAQGGGPRAKEERTYIERFSNIVVRQKELNQ